MIFWHLRKFDFRVASTTIRSLCAVVLGLAMASSFAPLFAQQSEAEIQQWVTALDDDQYLVRKQAQQQLEAAGRSALAAVAAAARSGSLESTTRALHVLLLWSESDDAALRIDALQHIADLPNRKIEARMASESLAEVREQAALEALVAAGGVFERDDLVPLGRRITGQNQSPLRVIITPNWKGGDNGLKHLRELQRATTISFRSAPITDKALVHLTHLPNLRRIQFYGTKLSEPALQKLKKTLTGKVTVDVRSTALLGVSGLSQRGPAQVGSVVQGSAADKGGLQPGDVILELDGEKIGDFEGLTRRIATHEAGDSVTLKILRKGKPQDVKITFDRWGDSKLQLDNRRRSRIRMNITLPVQR